jgi:hypothetical protein
MAPQGALHLPSALHLYFGEPPKISHLSHEINKFGDINKNRFSNLLPHQYWLNLDMTP